MIRAVPCRPEGAFHGEATCDRCGWRLESPVFHWRTDEAVAWMRSVVSGWHGWRSVRKADGTEGHACPSCVIDTTRGA